MWVKGTTVLEVKVNDNQIALIMMGEMLKSMGESVPLGGINPMDIEAYHHEDGKILKHVPLDYRHGVTGPEFIGEANEDALVFLDAAKRLYRKYR